MYGLNRQSKEDSRIDIAKQAKKIMSMDEIFVVFKNNYLRLEWSYNL